MLNTIELLRQIDPKVAEWLESNYPDILNTTLKDAFVWADSPQGYRYWSAIQNLLADIEETSNHVLDLRAKKEKRDADKYTVARLIRYLEALPPDTTVHNLCITTDVVTNPRGYEVSWPNSLNFIYSKDSNALRIGEITDERADGSKNCMCF